MNREMTRLDPQLRPIVADQRYPLAFATVSGAHLYGFPSRDSDADLRGAHVLPAAEVVGLRQGPQTLSAMWTDDGAEMDVVTHGRRLGGVGAMHFGEPGCKLASEVDHR